MTTRILFAVADVGYASDISDQRNEPTHIHAAASYPLTAPERRVIRAEEEARDQEYAQADATYLLQHLD
jgi:hypothetical protein